ncbi:MAG: hypothetical protein ACRD29_15115 [Acidimicrobiales bacterium]
MEIITEEAVIRCSHDGKIQNELSQDWVTIAGIAIIVENDPEGREIVACPNIGPTVKSCQKTLKVDLGYSTLIRIGTKPMVLSNLDGLTDGQPPGTFHYNVRHPGQFFVRSDA